MGNFAPTQRVAVHRPGPSPKQGDCHAWGFEPTLPPVG